MEPKFKVGDKVRAFGIDGVVTGTTSFITVSFPSKEMNFVFLPDGRTREWHNDPSLVLIERPKKKITKEIKGCYATVDKYGSIVSLTTSCLKAVADRGQRDYQIVELTGKVELEEP